MMFLSLGNLFFLDYLLLKKTGKRLHADGVKDDPFYEPKNELLNLGLPEHLILWPVLYCPIVGFIAAVILNTAGFYIIFNLVGAVLTWITGHESFSLLAKSGASLGVGVTFLAVAHVCSKETK